MPNLPMLKSVAVQLLNQYGSLIDSSVDKEIINNIVSKIREQARQIEKLAKRAYIMLGCKSGNLEDMEAELNERIISLQNETINLNGPMLEETFLKDLQDANVFKYDQQKEYVEFLRYIESQTNYTLQNNIPQILDAAVGEILIGNLNASTTTNKGNQVIFSPGTVSSTGRGVGGQYAGKMSECFSDMSKLMQNKIDNYYRKNYQKIKSFSINSSSTYNGFNITANWEQIPVESFLRMNNNKGERDRFFNQYPELKQQILDKYKQKILNMNMNVSRKDLFKDAIDQVFFSGNADAMFGLTGKNLIGRLGEIQALYYIKVLTNNAPSSMLLASKWIGGINNPHADELLRGLLGSFGIQVKNTVNGSGDYQVDFKDFGVTNRNKKRVKVTKIGGQNLPNLLSYAHTKDATNALKNMSSKLFGTNGILPEQDLLIEGIETILGMYTFNIEYLWHTDGTKPKYYAGSNPEFSEVRARIEDLAKKANKIMSLMAVSLMYMQTITQSYGESNTLYLIGGTTIISAASILYQIAQEVQDDVNYIDSSFRMSSGDGTIVDVLNEDKHISTLNFALKSSYTFIKK